MRGRRVAPDENGELRDPVASPQDFKDSLVGRIPKEWAVGTFDNAIGQPGGLTIGPFGSNLLSSDYRREGVPIVFVRDIRMDEFIWTSEVYVSQKKAAELSAHSVSPGDVVITKMGLPPCIAAVYPEWMPTGLVTADLIRLRALPSLAIPHWLSIYINSPAFAACVRRITGGITRPKVTLADFRKLPLLLPPRDEQQRIEAVLQAGHSGIVDAQIELRKLKELKSGLMSDVLTGRVRVSSDLDLP